ncbi:hypothetical protein HI795_14245 [Ralstonia solanacearum]|nr:hypothetical protein HI816_14245 [Ralstonia solanacearum]QKM24176.1 hypothetical protein HI796_14240 [Ralstonia solanacearum]QKM28984.1 hypothetical protein HI795_14245 [Ralstonia solanacearum]
MSEEQLREAILALREGHWDQYEALMRPLLKSNNDEIWTRLAAEHPAPLNLLSVLSQLSSEQARAACHWLLPAIGKLSALSLSEAFSLLDFAETLDASYWYVPAQQLAPHIAERTDLGAEIGEGLRADPRRGDALQRVWAVAFSSAAPQIAARQLAVLMTGSQTDTQLLIHLLHALRVDVPAVQAELAGCERPLADFLLGQTGEFGHEAWSAMTCIASLSPTAVGYLLGAVDSADSQAVGAIANSLYQLKGIAVESLQRILNGLVTIGVQNEQPRAQIDQGIESLIFSDELRPYVVASLLDLCSLESDAVEMFKETFGGLAEHPTEFFRVLSEWLVRPVTSFSSVASLLTLCTSRRAPVGLDGAVFAAHEPDSWLKAARRLLALTHHGPTLCQFIAAIAAMESIGDARLQLAGQMLNITFTEYPSATEQFLKAKTAETSRSDPTAHVFRGVYANALRWRRVLARLPARKELRPSELELQALRAMKRRINREIMRAAEEQSVFRQMVSKSHIAQGRKFASHTPFGPPQVTEMAQSSHSVELPSSELADPMRGILERRKLLESAR